MYLKNSPHDTEHAQLSHSYQFYNSFEKYYSSGIENKLYECTKMLRYNSFRKYVFFEYTHSQIPKLLSILIYLSI